MRGKRTILLRCGVMWLLLWAVAWGLDAPPKERVDLTGREELTPEEIVRGLILEFSSRAAVEHAEEERNLRGHAHLLEQRRAAAGAVFFQ